MKSDDIKKELHYSVNRKKIAMCEKNVWIKFFT